MPLLPPPEAAAYDKKIGGDRRAHPAAAAADPKTLEEPYRAQLLPANYKKFPENVQTRDCAHRKPSARPARCCWRTRSSARSPSLRTRSRL